MAALLALLAATALPQAGTIEVPFREGENAIIIDATLNGKKLSFMFDTGFGGAFVVDQSINLGKSTGAMTLRDFVGEFQASTVNLKTVKVGEKTIPTPDLMAVMQPADYSFSYNTHCDGIMGLEVVKHTVFEINYEHNKLIFHPTSMDISKRVPDNKRTFLAKLLPIGMNTLEMEVRTKDNKRLALALDTGNSFFATTHRDVLERVGLWKGDQRPRHVKQSFVASGAVDSFTVNMKGATIFGVPVPNSYWDIIDLPSSSAEGDGTVGHQFLKNFNIIVDYDRRRVWLENFTGKVENTPEGSIGIAAAYVERAGRTLVVNVAPDSPAARAGVQRGDALLSIDGKELIGKIGYGEVNDRLVGAVGSKVSLGLSRSGQSLRLELERQALVNELAD